MYIEATIDRITGYRLGHAGAYIKVYQQAARMPESILREALGEAREAASYILNTQVPE